MTGSWRHTSLAQLTMFGEGGVERLAEVVKDCGCRRVVLVTSAGRLASTDGQRIERLLGRVRVLTLAEVRPHLPTSVVQSALAAVRREGIDGIVSFGGGSCIDLGKAIGWFGEQEAGTPGVSFRDRPTLPHVAVPTTYSGAEQTAFFGMTDERTRTKAAAGGPTSAPLAVVYDPILTLATPALVSAETGMNALAHCVEAAYSPRRTPEAEAIALAGLARIAGVLPLVVDEPDSLPARIAMLEGAALAGRCLMNAGAGVHHGLAQLLGGRTGISHGLANALLLPHAMRFNAVAVPNELARIGAALGDPDDPAGAVERLVARLGLPERLSDAGVEEADLDAVARLSQSSAVVRANPRPVTEDDARMILEAAF